MDLLFILSGAVAILAVLAVYLFFLQSRYQRDSAELSQDLTQLQQNFAQLNEKHAQLSDEKHRLEQWAVQQQTQMQNAKERLEERAAQIQKLEGQIAQAAEQENAMESTINVLKEGIGAAQAKSQGLAEQLADSRQAFETEKAEHQRMAAQFSQTQQELAELRSTLSEKQANFEAQQRNFVEVKQQMTVEFQHLAQQILEEKSKSFAESNQSNLNLLLKPFKEQIEGFQKRVNEVHSEAVKGNANLEAEIKRVLEIGLSMSQEANNLTTALKGNNKVAGNWGEIQLEGALQSAGLMAQEHYLAQENYVDEEGKRFIPDFVVKLPNDKHLILDSKVSLVAYERAVLADDRVSAEQALNDHCHSIRKHIEDLSKKNYSNLVGVKSPDFVLMFVPIEPAYIEALKYDPQLFNYGYEKNVILVSYTTLMPILRTVANLWRIEQGNSEAREIIAKAEEIYNQVCKLAERLNNVGKGLNTANRCYNEAVTALVGQRGLMGKVERFKALSVKTPKTMPEVNFLTNDLDTAKLEAVIEKERE